ncbi:RipA family octameric membrane protein [Leclercia sp. UBA7405]|uniref:RipA family octameric membrane protein n=1 Tax=Leclercia sp. UBA7405 TaxID=1946743 RepID=UPI003018A0F7
MTKYKCNTNEPLDDRGVALHLTSHFDNNKEYFNKLLSKDFSLAEVYLTLQDKERMKEAYNKAHHVREYEINLFWSRLNYLWAITAVLCAAGGVILNDMINLAEGKEVNELQFLSLFSVSIFGFSLTTVSIFCHQSG